MTVAYFCSEFGIEDNLPIYAGGLGVLAGDLLLEAGREGLDFVGVGLLYSHGFYENHQLDPRASGFTLEPMTISVEIGKEEVAVQVWSKTYGSARLFLLDAGEITKNLYDADPMVMHKQQMVLGIGGVRLLRKKNINPRIYHLNEGHTAMAILELAGQENKIVATKHTIFSGAGLHLTPLQMQTNMELYLKKYQINFDGFFSQGEHTTHPGIFATTNFLLKQARKQNGVSILHVEMEKKAHPASKLIAITNGINISRWDQFAQKTKNDCLTVVWARRFAPYKRPELIFTDVERLKMIVKHPQMPVKFIITGRANPTDQSSLELEDKIRTQIINAGLEKNIFFSNDYDLISAKKLVATADVWLNTPIPGQEACGTSGMKAGLNGALLLSTNDGWMQEVDWYGLGWVLDSESTAEDFYHKMESDVVPLYYNDPAAWHERSLRTRSLVLDYFNTKRVLEDYEEKLYS